MQPINTLTVDGQTYVIQDPNALTEQILEEKKPELVQAVLQALPVYNGEVAE